jgi:hypothetical protein
LGLSVVTILDELGEIYEAVERPHAFPVESETYALDTSYRCVDLRSELLTTDINPRSTVRPCHGEVQSLGGHAPGQLPLRREHSCWRIGQYDKSN